MKTIFLKGIAGLFFWTLATSFITSQDSSNKSDKEIIIIERTLDENGREISKIITRKKESDFSDEELNELIENGTFQRDFDDYSRSFRLDEFDWPFQNDNKPTIGLSLRFEEDKAIVSKVMPGSDAFEKDVREGDQLISINSLPISTYEDVQESLNGRSVGDEVKVVVIRDGIELEKRIELRINLFGEMGFTFPEEWGENGFFFDLNGEGEFKLFADSLLRDYDFRRLMPDLGTEDYRTELGEVEEKGQLGVFIEDTQEGVLITEVIEDSPAEKAGLREGDVITRMNDEVITSYRELLMVMKSKTKGDKISIDVKRKNKIKKVEVKLN